MSEPIYVECIYDLQHDEVWCKLPLHLYAEFVVYQERRVINHTVEVFPQHITDYTRLKDTLRALREALHQPLDQGRPYPVMTAMADATERLKELEAGVPV